MSKRYILLMIEKVAAEPGWPSGRDIGYVVHEICLAGVRPLACSFSIVQELHHVTAFSTSCVRVSISANTHDTSSRMRGVTLKAEALRAKARRIRISWLRGGPPPLILNYDPVAGQTKQAPIDLMIRWVGHCVLVAQFSARANNTFTVNASCIMHSCMITTIGLPKLATGSTPFQITFHEIQPPQLSLHARKYEPHIPGCNPSHCRAFEKFRKLRLIWFHNRAPYCPLLFCPKRK